MVLGRGAVDEGLSFDDPKAIKALLITFDDYKDSVFETQG